MHRFATIGVALLLTLLTGFLLSRLGKPYNGLIFNLHKLVALGAIVAAAVQLHRLLGNISGSASLMALLLLIGLSALALFVSGALLSAGQFNYRLLLGIHRLASVTFVFGSTAFAVTVAKYLTWI